MILGILIFLVVINPVVAVLAFVLFGGLYAALFGIIRPRLARYGKDVGDSNLLRYKAASEAFGGIKDVKILGKEPFFAWSFGIGAKRFAATQSAYRILTGIPGQSIQALAIGFAVVLIIILLNTGSLVQILPMLAIYAFAIMRIIPHIQTFFQSTASVRYYAYTVNALYKDMTTISLPPDASDFEAMNMKPEILPFMCTIELKGIEFSYSASREPVLKGIDLHIKKDTSVGFVGTTGCGKTTLVDVIMGLLEPSAGSIIVDDIPVLTASIGGGSKMNISPWQRNFGYVPQQIYLSDDTIAANIAFGVPDNMRNSSAIERAARAANLHEYITTELSDGYNTFVGERGVKLSGGQRQRIGIARSLYHDPAILVMDEATSALDTVTEDAVMEAIHNLMHLKTIIIIAHRISTIRECEMICVMEKGKIITQGSYDELIQTSVEFRAMAKKVTVK
jgi:ABC-type multidrug transport system fused ATPase/permease subunit